MLLLVLYFVNSAMLECILLASHLLLRWQGHGTPLKEIPDGIVFFIFICSVFQCVAVYLMSSLHGGSMLCTFNCLHCTYIYVYWCLWVAINIFSSCYCAHFSVVYTALSGYSSANILYSLQPFGVEFVRLCRMVTAWHIFVSMSLCYLVFVCNRLTSGTMFLFCLLLLWYSKLSMIVEVSVHCIDMWDAAYLLLEYYVTDNAKSHVFQCLLSLCTVSCCIILFVCFIITYS